MTDKEFTLKYVFENVGKLEEEKFLYSSVEENIGMKWKANLLKQNGFLGIWLYANMNKNQEIQSDFTVNIFSKKKEEIHSKFRNCVFENTNGGWDNWGWHKFVDWETLEDDYLNDGKLEVEIRVKITKMVGLPEGITGLPRKELRSFGEDMKQFSDVMLKVKERKFYVSKLYLSSHSPYFATLFLGKFQESEKSEIELKYVNSEDFQYYLEVLYGENGIDDDTVEGILSVADMFDTSLIVKNKLCLDQIKSKDDICSVIPEDPREVDHEVLAELLKKALVFN